MSEKRNLRTELANAILPKNISNRAGVAVSADQIRLIQAGIAKGTKRVYLSAWNQFCKWRGIKDETELVYFGSNQVDAIVSTYATHLYCEGQSPSYISLQVSALKRVAKLLNLNTGWIHTSETLKGIRREGRERGRGQSRGLTYEDSVRCMNFAEQQRPHETEHRSKKRSKVDRAIIALLFMAGLRRSEVASLQWRDVEEGAKIEEGFILVRVRSSKTNQEGRLDVRLLKGIGAEAIRHLRWSGCDPTEPVIKLSDRQIARRFLACVESAGLKGEYTSHSGRIGLASELTSRGASSPEIALAGGWKSERMVLHYGRRARVERGAVAKYL
ncbi:MAG: tyrosine-type recombinase/integrase [Gammaproteobacteria bacterium]|nr:tyrosine-type recombinase/integrase [Gammaproteobacteria bacterium]